MRSPLALARVMVSVAAIFMAAFGYSQLPPIFPPQFDTPVIEPSDTEPTQDISGQEPPGTAERRLEIESADSFTQEGDKARLEGNVLLRWGDYRLKGDLVEGDTKTHQFRFTGNVAITGGGQMTRGDELFIDFRQKTWTFRQGSTVLTPELLQGNLLGEIFAQGEMVEGTPAYVIARSAAATTCELPHPHYRLTAKFIDFQAERRLILRHVGIEVLGKRILTIPHVVIPLQGGRYNGILPDVGQSPDEGWYIKSAFGYVTAPRSFGNLKLDVMQKKGIGAGFDHEYAFATAAGTLGVYFLANQTGNSRDLNAHWANRQKFGSLQTDFRTDFRRNSYFSFPENTTWSNVMNLSVPNRGGETRLSGRFFENTSDSFNNRSLSALFADTRRFGSAFRWSVNVGYQGAESRSSFGETKREAIDIRSQFNLTGKRFDTDLNIQTTTPIGSSANFYAGLEKLPEFVLRTDARRLLGDQFERRWLPFNATLNLGDYAEQNTTRTQRLAFDLSSSKSFGGSTGFGVTTYNILRQSFYGDGTAQYVLQNDLEARYGWNERSSFSLRYNYLRPYGFSPFFFDRSGSYNFVSGSLNFQAPFDLSFRLQSGFDLLADERGQEPWQSALLNIEWRPRKWFRVRTAAAYDPNAERLTSLRGDLAWNAGATRVDLTARYDPRRETLANANLRVDALKWGRLSTQALLLYDGYLKAFTSRQFVFTYDLHCAEAVLSYLDNPYGFRPGRNVMLFIRIKALPFFNRFGLGQQGEFLGSGGSGEIY